jgi:hypothetical protein
VKPDAGPWSAGRDEEGRRTYIESQDFKHDVRLYVDGDFESDAERMAYAIDLAERMSAMPVREREAAEEDSAAYRQRRGLT